VVHSVAAVVKFTSLLLWQLGLEFLREHFVEVVTELVSEVVTGLQQKLRISM